MGLPPGGVADRGGQADAGTACRSLSKYRLRERKRFRNTYACVTVAARTGWRTGRHPRRLRGVKRMMHILKLLILVLEIVKRLLDLFR